MHPKSTIRLPENDPGNGWSRLLPSRQPHTPLTSTISADWLVVGAGFAGLAAARRLAENCPDHRIVVLEAGTCGENASGRNSGFAIDIPHTTSSNLQQLDGARRHLRLARAAIEELSRVVHSQGISCDWSVSGKYHAAITARGRRQLLEPLVAELESLGEAYNWVEGKELSAKIGTGHFRHAVYTPGCVLMNPAALTRGLADTMPSNVEVFENSPILHFDAASTASAQTPEGLVKARRVLIAANGFTEQFGVCQRQFVHLVLHGSLSRPLDQAERAIYGVSTPWGVTPANGFGGITMRFTSDHRLLIRQDIRLSMAQRMKPSTTRQIARQHQLLLRKHFPDLPKLNIEHTWCGYVCLSKNGAPAFSQQTDNIWVAACQNGIGITRGTISGLLAADLACDKDNPLIADMQQLGTPARLPPRPILDMGARAMMARELWKNRDEI